MTRCTLAALLFLTGPAFGAGPAPAPEGVGPAEIPTLDVEANVRRMLEESRARQGQSPAPGAATESAAPAAGQEKVPSRALRREPATAGSGPEPEDYVPLPEETITVRSVGDVETVSRQLQEAKRRKAGSPPPAPAAGAP